MGSDIYVCSDWSKECIEHIEVDRSIAKIIQRLNENGIKTHFSHSGLSKDHPKEDPVHKWGANPYISYIKRTPTGKVDRKFYGCIGKKLMNNENYKVNFIQERKIQSISNPKHFYPKESTDNDIKKWWKDLETYFFKCLIREDI